LKGGHPLEIPEGRWKYETTRWRSRGCVLAVVEK